MTDSSYLERLDAARRRYHKTRRPARPWGARKAVLEAELTDEWQPVWSWPGRSSAYSAVHRFRIAGVVLMAKETGRGSTLYARRA